MPEERAARQTIRKEPEVIDALLNQLDRQQHRAANVPNHARRSERYPYRVKSLTVELPRAGSTPLSYLVPTRNLSREGVAFLFGRFVYPGTACQMHLLSLQHEEITVAGAVVRCRYLEGSACVYEVGVKFDHTIDLAMFHRGASQVRILLIDDDPAMHRLIPHLLKPMKIQLTTATSGQQGVELATSGSFDVVLLDLDMPDPDGFAVAKELRAAGCLRPIIAITAFTGEDIRRKCIQAGCRAYLNKPLTRDALLTAVSSTLDELVVSPLAQDPDMAPLINEFVTQLPARIEEMNGALRRNDLAALEHTARQIKGEAGSFGFDIVTQAADILEQAIREQAHPDSVRQKLNDLARWCSAARSASPPPEAPG